MHEGSVCGTGECARAGDGVAVVALVNSPLPLFNICRPVQAPLYPARCVRYLFQRSPCVWPPRCNALSPLRGYSGADTGRCWRFVACGMPGSRRSPTKKWSCPLAIKTASPQSTWLGMVGKPRPQTLSGQWYVRLLDALATVVTYAAWQRHVWPPPTTRPWKASLCNTLCCVLRCCACV
jgi:hypothetical protein